MGATFVNEVQSFSNSVPPLEEDTTRNIGIRCYKKNGDSKVITPEVLSSHVLSFLKNAAEQYLIRKSILGLPNRCEIKDSHGIVKRVVIGVPAHFNERKRDATKRAALLAGFEEVIIIPFKDYLDSFLDYCIKYLPTYSPTYL